MNLRLFRQRLPEPSARAQRDVWLQWLELGSFSPKTIDGYRRITDLLLNRFPTLALSEFTDEHIQGVIEEAKPASRQSRRGAFANLFGWALRTKRIGRNPMIHVVTYKQPAPPPIETFTEAESKVLCALPEPDGTLMAVLFGSGIRKSEARHLTVHRVDLDHGELHVVEGAKGGSVGVVPLSAALVSRLAGYFITEGLNQEDHLWYCHPGGTKKRRHDRAIAEAAMHSWWNRCVDASGVPYRHLHTTRHTYAERLRRQGMTLDDVGFVLRHADKRTTERVYAHTKIFDVRKRMAELGALQ